MSILILTTVTRFIYPPVEPPHLHDHEVHGAGGDGGQAPPHVRAQRRRVAEVRAGGGLPVRGRRGGAGGHSHPAVVSIQTAVSSTPTLHIPLPREGLGRFWKICEESFLIFIAFLEILFLLPIIFWLRYWHFDIVLNSSLNRKRIYY